MAALRQALDAQQAQMQAQMAAMQAQITAAMAQGPTQEQRQPEGGQQSQPLRVKEEELEDTDIDTNV